MINGLGTTNLPGNCLDASPEPDVGCTLSSRAAVPPDECGTRAQDQPTMLAARLGCP